MLGGLWAALYHPWVFLGLLAVFILLAIWLLPKLWRAIKFLFAKLRQLFGGPKAESLVTASAALSPPATAPPASTGAIFKPGPSPNME